MSVLSRNELKRRLSKQIPSSRQMNQERIKKQRLNTSTIYELDRDGLVHDSFERRMLVYSTLFNERIFIEYPGKEAMASSPMVYDTCPGLANEEQMITLDTSFGDIWNVLDYLGRSHKAYMPVLATVLIYMSNMLNYRCVDTVRQCFDITIDSEEKNYVEIEPIRATFYELNFTKRIWETLNDMFTGINIKGQELSFEAFIKYFDVLLMNEDSKYAHKAIQNEETTFDTWNYRNGRTNTIGTCLNVVGYLDEKISMSDLLDKFQKGRGTMSFPIRKYPDISDNIITQ